MASCAQRPLALGPWRRTQARYDQICLPGRPTKAICCIKEALIKEAVLLYRSLIKEALLRKAYQRGLIEEALIRRLYEGGVEKETLIRRP